MTRLASVTCVWLGLALRCYSQATSGASGTIRGTVLDPSGAIVAGATVEIQNPVSHYSQTKQTDSSGAFQFTNIPFNNYHLSVNAPGFQASAQDVNVRSSVVLQLKISMQLGEASTSVTVSEAGDLLETDSTAHTDVDRSLIDKLPLESASSSLSSLVTLASPGVTADSNGLFQEWAITRRIPSPSMASRLPISRARFSPTNFPLMRCNRWR